MKIQTIQSQNFQSKYFRSPNKCFSDLSNLGRKNHCCARQKSNEVNDLNSAIKEINFEDFYFKTTQNGSTEEKITLLPLNGVYY